MNNTSIDYLVENSPSLQRLSKELNVATRTSLTGITNFVTNYEDPDLVKKLIDTTFKKKNLFNNTIDIDAVELQQGVPGQGKSVFYLDELIFGSFVYESDDSSGFMNVAYDVNPQTGTRRRKPNGFVNNPDILSGNSQERILIINNIDNCADFCPETSGKISYRSLDIFDRFRIPLVKKGCSLLLITNQPLIFPFSIRKLELNTLGTYEAEHLFDSVVSLYRERGHYSIEYNDQQKNQIVRKLTGLTYTQAGDAFIEAISYSRKIDEEKVIDTRKSIQLLRKSINKNFLQSETGLTHLKPQVWDDYILPSSSDFTYDVKKILRDLQEINELKKNPTEQNLQIIDSIQQRIQHIIVLYGAGGVGKSAFPIHFAGLLDFDVWDFNINATHSKWVGEGAERMRNTLKKISQSSHLVVRIDEYDRAMGSTTSSGEGMHEAHKQVESELMNWLQNCQEDNIFVKQNIFLVFTTNHKENITGPLLRSGRADLVINISNFDEDSIIDTFTTASQRIFHRGINVLGFSDPDKLNQAIRQLDLAKLAQVAVEKGFTVRDIDMLIIEMAIHDYYYRICKSNLSWNSHDFERVLKNSMGSNRGEKTGELVLGDRYLQGSENKEKIKVEKQTYFPFMTNTRKKELIEEISKK